MHSKITFNKQSNDLLSVWVADAIAPAYMHILCIALRYNKPNKLENYKSILFVTLFNKTRALVLFLGFQYFELQNIYIDIRIPIFSSEFVHT